VCAICFHLCIIKTDELDAGACLPWHSVSVAVAEQHLDEACLTRQTITPSVKLSCMFTMLERDVKLSALTTDSLKFSFVSIQHRMTGDVLQAEIQVHAADSV